ncbi:MAG: serine/threonine protein phosphatase [Pseudomonas fluorescens]|nr:MAG: serine/threonine protein phosphatase [Pseudomonas fluorescens]
MLSTFSHFWGRSNSPNSGEVASIPEGIRVYAVGDIHGRRDLIEDMLTAIKADSVSYTGKVILVCVGDYIDRGPDSKGVVDALLNDIPEQWETIFLRGNHEQVMLNFIENPKMRTEWMAWGGLQALESYGIAPYGSKGLRDPEALAAEVNYVLEEVDHKNFFSSTRMWYVCGSYLFVHAGVRPSLRLDRQMDEDLLFIRDDFLGKPHGLPYRIVFGHTIFDNVLIENDRIALDTGAFQSGKLSCICLEGTEASVLQVVR